MRISLRKRTVGQIEFGLIYGGIALLALAAGRFLPVLALAPSCVFKGLSGIPCPTCGSTRSIVHLSHGHIFDSLIMNPLVSLCAIAAVLSFAYSLVTLMFDLPRFGLVLSEREKDSVRVGAVLLVLANWAYLAVKF